MNILIVTHYFLPHLGGIEVIVLNQAKALAANGHTVTVLSSRMGNEPEREHMHGFTVLRINALNHSERDLGIPYPLFHPGKLRRTMRACVEAADIVHAHGSVYMGTVAAAYACRRQRKPFVVTEHVGLVPYNNKLFVYLQHLAHKTLSKYTYKHARVIMTYNSSVAAHIRKLAPPTTIISSLPNGVDTELFSPATASEKHRLRREFGLPETKPLALFVGRFVEKKGFSKMLQATSEEYIIVFVGDNQQKTKIIGDKTIFLPGMTQSELAKAYKLADVFILPSVGEGFPLSIQEAMASGLPIITTDEPAYAQYLNQESAVLIQPTIQGIKKSLRTLLKDEKKRETLSKVGREIASTQFSWRKSTKKLLAEYIEAL